MANFIQNFNDPNKKLKKESGIPKGLTGAFNDPNVQINPPKVTGQYIPPRDVGERQGRQQRMTAEEYASGGWQTMIPEERRRWELQTGYNPSRQPTRQQGRQATISNPAFGDVPAQTATFGVPEEGEVFGSGRDIYAIKDGKLIGLDAEFGFPQIAGVNKGKQIGDFAESAGLSNLSQYNIADVVSIFGDVPGQGLGQQLSPEDFKKAIAGLQVQPGQPLPTGEVDFGYGPNLSGLLPPSPPPEAGGRVSMAGGQDSGWIDPATGQSTPVGVGVPAPTAGQPPPGATYISDPAELAGLTEEQIWRDPNSDRIYKKNQATLTSPTGEKKVVDIGGTEANMLLGAGWTLGDKIGGGTVTADTLTDIPEIDIGTGIPGDTGSVADSAAAGIGVDVKANDDLIKHYQDLLTQEETDLAKQVSDLLGETGKEAGELTGRGAMQLAEEDKRDIEQKQQTLASKNTEIKRKLAEIKELTASYQLANQMEEGRPQTLSRLRGEQAQNQKIYLAKKNLMVSEASYLQAEALGLQGELDSAQAAADKAVELEYMDRESAYNAKIAQLNILMPQLTKEETKYAKAVEMALTQEANALADAKAEKKTLTDFNLGLMDRYPDAGITLSDTYESAQAKVPSSRVFQEAVRPPRGPSVTPKKFTFSSNDRGRLLAVGLSNEDVRNIESDLEEVSLDELVEGGGLNEEQEMALKNVLRGTTPTQELEKITADERKVIGAIQALITDNALIEEIEEYIRLKGYEPKDFKQYYESYQPPQPAEKLTGFEHIKRFFTGK